MTFLEKIRNLPENRKRIILWSVVIITAFCLFFVFLKNVQRGVKKLETSNFGTKIKMPDFSQELNGLPDMEMPQISDEDLKKMEEEMKKINAETKSTTAE